MLVLSRKVGEKIVIGENITVEIVRVTGNRITLGFIAPDSVKIRRGELTPINVETTQVEPMTEVAAGKTPLRQAS